MGERDVVRTDLVGGESHVGVCEKARSEEIAKGMIFFVKGEDCGVWGTCDNGGISFAWMGERMRLVVGTYECQSQR